MNITPLNDFLINVCLFFLFFSFDNTLLLFTNSLYYFIINMFVEFIINILLFTVWSINYIYKFKI